MKCHHRHSTAVLLLAAAAFAAHAQQSPVQLGPVPGVEGAVRDMILQPVPEVLPGSTIQIRTAPTAPPPTQPVTRGVQTIRPERRQVTVGGAAAFEPILEMELPVVELPDVGEPLSLNATDRPMPVIEILDLVAAATGWNVVASEGLEQRAIRLFVPNVKPKYLMEEVLRFHGIHFRFVPETNFLFVMLDGEFLDREYGAQRHKEFQIRHADVIDVEQILSGLMSQTGKLISDPRTGTILVWDTEANIAAMEKAVALVDVPLKPRVFTLKYLAAEDLVDTIDSLLSERGIAQADPRSNSIVVTDHPSRQDQIAETIETLDQKLETRTWTLSYADPEAVAERLEEILPEELGTITIDEDTHQISLTAIPSRIQEVDEIVKAWDVKGRQVQIEAYIVAASTAVTRDLTINWAYFDEIGGTPFAIQSGNARPDYTATPDAGQRVSAGRFPYRAFLRDPITGALVQEVDNPSGREAGSLTGRNILDPEFKGNRVAVVLDYLDRKGDLSILQHPRVTVQDGEEAVFENTTDRAFQSVGFTPFGGGVVDQPADGDQANVLNRVFPGAVSFIPVGTILKVKPRVNEEYNILMDIEVEDSTAEDKVIVSAGLESTVPEKTQNRAQTQVLVNDGQTIVIGGLRGMSLADDVDKVPILGELPFIGRFFKSTTKDHRNRELVVFLTPTIVDEYTQNEAQRLATFEAEGMDALRHSEKSVWGRAYDRVVRGRNEFSISIGHTGNMHAEGKMVTVADLEARFKELAVQKVKPVVILRVHPDAPPAIAVEITELAMESGLKLRNEPAPPPFVPAQRDDAPAPNAGAS
jgi:general secretion pathway protein D